MPKLLPKHGCSQEDHIPNCGHFGQSGLYLSEHAKDCDNRKNSRYECTCNPRRRRRKVRDHQLELKVEKTGRGFRIISFKDDYRVECSLQESSLATEDAIWFGCNKADPQTRIPGKNGWHPIEMPEHYIANTRMHLTRDQVAVLLPYLKAFVETGELPKEKL